MKDETISQLIKISTPKYFVVKDYVCQEGQPGNEMYFILKGSVGIYITSAIGTLNKVATIEEGGFFGEMAIFDNLPRSASCIAEEDTMAVAVNQENLQAFLTTCPGIAMKILENLSGRIRKLNAELYQNNRFVKNRHVPAFSIPTEYTIGHVVKAPYQDSRYISQSVQVCPICGKEIVARDLKRNLLEEKSFGMDCRMTYVGCDPLWFEVISCSHCLYSNYYLKFFSINNFEQEIVQKVLMEHRIAIDACGERLGSYDSLIVKYLQAIHINEHINAGNNLLIGNLWRSIHWLSRDVSDDRFAMYSAMKAVERFKVAIEEGQIFDPIAKAATALSLVSMSMRCNVGKDILHYLDYAVKCEDDRIRGMAQRVKERLDQLQKK